MKINFDQPIHDLSGKEIPLDPKDSTKPITLKDVAVTALVTPLASDRDEAAAKAFSRYELARKVNLGGEVEIQPEDATVIRERAVKCYGVLVSGPAYEMLKGS